MTRVMASGRSIRTSISKSVICSEVGGSPVRSKWIRRRRVSESASSEGERLWSSCAERINRSIVVYGHSLDWTFGRRGSRIAWKAQWSGFLAKTREDLFASVSLRLRGSGAPEATHCSIASICERVSFLSGGIFNEGSPCRMA